MKMGYVFLLIAASLVIIGIVALDSPPNAVIKYESFGGFIAPSHARGLLTITSTFMNYTVYASDGNVTSSVQRLIDRSTYNALLKQFNNFTDYKAEYSKGFIPDVGSTRINLTTDGKTTSVLIRPGPGDPYPESLGNLMQSLSQLVPG
jgi:hypothetical protein